MKIYEKLESLAAKFEIRDANSNLIEGLKFLRKEFNCEDVHWYRLSELVDRPADNMPKPQKMLYSVDEHFTGFLPFVSSQPFDASRLSGQVGKLLQTLPHHWEGEEDCRSVVTSDGKFFLLPIRSTDLGETLGHVLMVGPKKSWGQAKKSLDVCRTFLERHMTYCLQFEAAKSMSYMDTLTHLYNQRYLSIALDREVHRSERYQRPFSVLFFDIDDFKSVNDQHGHLVGSAMISELGDLLKEIVRDSDYGFRFGGDEFVVLLAETGVDEAKFVAERFRKMVENKVFNVKGVEHRITISVGVATCPDHGRTKEQILSLADQAMYYGKRATKNTVYVAAS